MKSVQLLVHLLFEVLGLYFLGKVILDLAKPVYFTEHSCIGR